MAVRRLRLAILEAMAAQPQSKAPPAAITIAPRLSNICRSLHTCHLHAVGDPVVTHALLPATLAMSSTMNFRHDPLPDSQSHIRLLKLLNGEANEQIVCQLTTWSMQDAPPYYALSYTWGDPKDTAQIEIDGRTAIVTANCAYALRQAYACTNNIYLWMDALSIDQSSTQEKNHQVAMMGQIYEKAVHVLACIGPQSEDSEFLFEIMDANESLLYQISAHMSTSLVSGTGGWSLPNPIPKDRRLSLKCFFIMKESKRERVLRAFVNLLQRTYFSRVWILQELHSASRSSFCCGDELRPFRGLTAISMLIDYWMSREPIKWDRPWITRDFVITLSRLPWFRPQCYTTSLSLEDLYSRISMRHGCLALASGTRVPCQLSDVMRAMPRFECANYRDRLYGVLSLVDWDEGRGGRVPTPDYAKDVFSLAVEILEMYLDNPRLAPADTSNLHWADQVSAVFEIEPKQPSMRTAIRSRCHNRRATAEIISSNHLYTWPDDLYSSQPLATSSLLSSSSLRKVQPRLMPDDTWYGKRLLDPSDAEQHKHTADRPLFLLRTSGEEVNKIVDRNGKTIASVPKTTQPHDIYLFTCFVYTGCSRPPSMIVRTQVSGSYTIVGPATGLAGERAYLSWVETWDKFLVNWSAEDLLLYCWAHGHATLMSPSASWLDLDICGSPGSSHVIKVLHVGAQGRHQRGRRLLYQESYSERLYTQPDE